MPTVHIYEISFSFFYLLVFEDKGKEITCDRYWRSWLQILFM